MAPTFDFSNDIPKIVPSRSFNNNTENANFTDYSGSGDEYQADDDTLSQNINKFNIIEVSTTYDEINGIEEKLLNIEMENDNKLNQYNVFNVLDAKYGLFYDECNELDIKLHNINIAYKLNYDVLVRNTTMNVFEKIANDFEINFDYISLKENNNVYVLHNKEKKVENIKNNFPELNKIKNTRLLFKTNILDAMACLLTCKIQLFKYKKIKYNFYNNIKDFHILYDKHMKSYKESMKLFDAVLREVEEEIKKEKEEQLNNQLKKICEKLKVNKKKQNNLNNICKLINKLENQKVEKLYILSDIGKELKENNIRDEFELLEQFKDNDMYYIYDLKSKNKITRFINMCNKLYLLRNHIDLGNIISNNLLTSIRDMSHNNFTYLLSLF